MSKSLSKPCGIATAIGSMPHRNPEEACSLLLNHLPDIPVWPQLPKRSFLENMYVQFSEGFPGVVLEDNRIYINCLLNLDEPLERLYDAYIENKIEKYAVSQTYASGFHTFLSSKMKQTPLAVKGQVTGPISCGLAIVDQNRRPLLYDEVLADAIAKHLRLKASWQEKVLSSFFPKTIIFLDEPYLASLGSAFISIPQEQVVELLEETLGGIEGLKGIHCCGNTDWSLLLNTSIDILSFDAYSYGESLSLYPNEVKNFLARGGIIAWGIVPSNEENLAYETAESLSNRLSKMMKLLSKKGVNYNMIVEQCLITPSCGLGSVSVEMAKKALGLVREISGEFKKIKEGEIWQEK